ncbi:hypothetical protein FJR48_09010 [Sulfurimonas lithotrophica]|uniref:Uncharacterized protein n=1 Tax=Sulfurimonas lithotrophica TaxID=2590022 RepID=A0A5P8P2C7_9BACT|nr:hypothetical protein [Sulfurimonas lithotrophica]QFR49859.1 hypothetical protein FJR48_09010 [Sulfurimonas lithotrophica]
MYYIRKYTQSYWLRNQDYLSTNEISAEAVTRDLEARKNTLSFWRVNNIDDIYAGKDLGFLAFIGSLKSIDTTQVIIFNEDELNNFPLENNDGDTSLQISQDFHTDIIDLKLSSLNIFAKMFADKLYNSNADKESLTTKIKAGGKKHIIDKLQNDIDSLPIKTYTKTTISEIINNALHENTLTEEQLPKHMKDIL